MRQYLIFIILLLLVENVSGDELQRKGGIKLPPSVCYASHESHRLFIAPPVKLKAGSIKKSTIIVEYIGLPDEAKQAFQYAVDIWRDLIYSPVPIHIQATWKSLDKDVLGSCAPTDYVPNFNSSQIWNCYYPIALVEKMLGKEVNSPADSEIEASFNKDFKNWYFGIDGKTPIDKYDFVSTVLHELTHGLGFHGFFNSDSRGRGGYGDADGMAAAFDQFVINKNGDKLVNKKLFANPSISLNQNLTSGWLEFSTKSIEGTFPRLYAPSTWNSGSSIYHLDDAVYPAGDPNSLMTHAMGMGEAYHDPGPNTLAIMSDMGWKFLSMRHNPLKDIEQVTAPINFDVQIDSDYDLDSTKLYLVYSSNKFLKVDSIRLKATGTPTFFSTKLLPNQNSSLQYYFSASDVKKRSFVYPSDSPARYLSLNIGIDKVAPVVSHEPIKFLLSSSTSAKINAVATDNMGIKTVTVEYFLNGGAPSYLTLLNDSVDRYTTNLSFPKGSLRGGDFISYRIVATDISSQSNFGKQPLSGYNRFTVVGIQNPVDRYVTNFDAVNQDFFGADFKIETAAGFDSPALNSAHPYLSPDTDKANFSFSTILKYPIILNTKGMLSFDEIVLVEPGETGTKFGDENFWDYVIVEGSKDGGITWKPFADGYDSNLHASWLAAWNSLPSGNNSNGVPTKDLLVKHEINMLANGVFKTGDTVLIRFRLFSDPYSHGWGWVVDNLSIQDFETAVNPTLLSSGELSIFPNPASGRLNIQIEAKNDIRNLLVKAFDTSGKIVYSQSYKPESNLFQTVIDVSNFTPGLYLFELEPENGRVITRKIIVK